jgi:hypothetical protein
MTQKLATSADFSDELLGMFQKAAPFTRFLCQAVGVSF